MYFNVHRYTPIKSMTPSGGSDATRDHPQKAPPEVPWPPQRQKTGDPGPRRHLVRVSAGSSEKCCLCY